MRNGLRNRNQIAVLTPLIFADSDTVHRRHVRRGGIPRAELLDSAVQAGYVKGRHDRQARREPAIPDVLEPFVHVDDVDITSPGPGQSHREVAIDPCPALTRVFAQVITEAPRNGSVLLATYNGIDREGNDGSVDRKSTRLNCSH